MFASFAVCPRRRRESSRGASLIPCRWDLRLERVACVACVAQCHGDCCWAGRVGGAVPWGSASRARRVCGVCGAVPWGLLLGRSRGWRCAVGICVSGVSRVWRVWRCSMGIECWAGPVGGGGSASRACRVCGVCGAVPWGLLLGRSRAWRWDLRLGRVACVAWVALCRGDCCWAGRVGGAVLWGSASRARRVCGVRGAVPWGLLLGRSCGCRCAVGICVSGASRLWRVWRCAAVPWGLLLGRSRGWRCAVGLGRVATVACVALCHGDCCWAGRVRGAVPWGSASRARRVCGVGGAVPWGLLLGRSRGRRCAMEIAAGQVAWVALCHGDCCWAGRAGAAVPW